METFNLKKIRKNKGFTLETLSKKIGCSKSFLSYLENGKRLAGTKIATKISKELEIPFFKLRPDIQSLYKKHAF